MQVPHRDMDVLSSNAGLFAQVHRHVSHMDVICVRSQIFLIMLLNVQRWTICAYEQVSHRDTDVLCVRTQIFLIMILIVQRWIICAYEQIPHRNIKSSNAGLFAHMSKYFIET